MIFVLSIFDLPFYTGFTKNIVLFSFGQVQKLRVNSRKSNRLLSLSCLNVKSISTCCSLFHLEITRLVSYHLCRGVIFEWIKTTGRARAIFIV